MGEEEEKGWMKRRRIRKKSKRHTTQIHAWVSSLFPFFLSLSSIIEQREKNYDTGIERGKMLEWERRGKKKWSEKGREKELSDGPPLVKKTAHPEASSLQGCASSSLPLSLSPSLRTSTKALLHSSTLQPSFSLFSNVVIPWQEREREERDSLSTDILSTIFWFFPSSLLHSSMTCLLSFILSRLSFDTNNSVCIALVSSWVYNHQRRKKIRKRGSEEERLATGEVSKASNIDSRTCVTGFEKKKHWKQQQVWTVSEFFYTFFHSGSLSFILSNLVLFSKPSKNVGFSHLFLMLNDYYCC